MIESDIFHIYKNGGIIFIALRRKGSRYKSSTKRGLKMQIPEFEQRKLEAIHQFAFFVKFQTWLQQLPNLISMCLVKLAVWKFMFKLTSK